MRAIVASSLAVTAAVTIAAPTPARADSFVDLFGGISIPVEDEDWTDAVESSPVLGLRVGSVPNQIGGYLSADWMPTNTDAQGWNLPGTTGDISAHRFRLMVGPLFQHTVSNTLAVTGRAGIGADIAYASVSGTVFGAEFEESETDVGLGFEFAGGLWFKLGSLAIGGEVALPIAVHDDDNEQNRPDFIYTSVDLQILFGVRFSSR